ncbi:MAG: hypothetical protein JHC52_04205 [Chthoniobacterales bacterium]|jgi:hypothetical protein|nr:hypothetical protein [Chthoniobacterales bacterium]
MQLTKTTKIYRRRFFATFFLAAFFVAGLRFATFFLAAFFFLAGIQNPPFQTAVAEMENAFIAVHNRVGRTV